MASSSTEEASASASTSQPENENKEETKQKKEDEDDESDKEPEEKMFECNICLDTAKDAVKDIRLVVQMLESTFIKLTHYLSLLISLDAVVTYCGHLFCWPCLYQWLETRPNRQSCPVCKAAISRDKCIPLYGRGGKDPRSKVPPRPPKTRTEQTDSGRLSWGSNEGNGGFHMSFGIGAFPFGFFASAFNFGAPGTTPAVANFMTPQQIEEQEFLSKVFIWVALIFIVWLMLA